MAKKTFSERLFDFFIPGGEKIRIKAKKNISAHKDLEMIITETEIFAKTKAHLLPLKHYVEEFYTPTRYPPQYLSSEHFVHPKYPNSHLTKKSIKEFFDAKGFLEFSIEKGKYFAKDKNELLEELLNLGDKYITGKNPKAIKEMTDYELFYQDTDKLIQKTETILEKYQEFITHLKQRVRAADYELIKLGAAIAAVSLALVITIGYKAGKLKH